MCGVVRLLRHARHVVERVGFAAVLRDYCHRRHQIKKHYFYYYNTWISTAAFPYQIVFNNEHKDFMENLTLANEMYVNINNKSYMIYIL